MQNSLMNELILRKQLDRIDKMVMGNLLAHTSAMDSFNENEAARQQREKEIQDEIRRTGNSLEWQTIAPTEEKARAAEARKRELEQEVNEIENEREGEIEQLRTS